MQAFKFEEVRYYFGIILAAILVIGLNTAHLFRNLGEAFQQAAFQVGSIITTTGFSSTDFSQWPSLSKTILVLLMFVYKHLSECISPDLSSFCPYYLSG